MKRLTGRRLPDQTPVALEIEDGKIARVEPLSAEEATGGRSLPYLAPGFIDIQVNGYRRLDYCMSGLSPNSVAEVARLLAASGTTRHVPTIVTNPEELICANLGVIARAIRSDPLVAAAVPGIHVEGPFISPEDGPRGAHQRSQVRRPDVEEYRRWQDAAEGHLKMVTVAPEMPGALPFIEALREDGVIPAIGHTGATGRQIRDAVAAGALVSTHLGNGSHSMLPRLENYLWEQLAADELMAGMVADGYHLPPAAMKSIIRGKSLQRIILVSDVTALGGVDPGVYDWAGIRVRVFDDGHLGLEGTDYLAGAGHLLDRGIAIAANVTGEPLGRIVETCTANPARLFGWAQPKLEPGSVADVVLFTFAPGEERIRVLQTIGAGQTLYDASEAAR